MKKLVCICLLILGSSFLAAQISPPALTLGPVLKDEDKTNSSMLELELLGLHQGNVYAFDYEYEGKSIVLEFFIYGEDLTFQEKKKLTITNSLKPIFKRLIMLEDRTYAVLSSQDRKSKINKILLQEIDLAKMQVVGTHKVIASIPILSKTLTSKLRFEFSLSKKKILLWNVTSTSAKPISRSYTLCAFDNTFSPLWQYEDQLLKTEKHAHFGIPNIDDNGLVVWTKYRNFIEKNEVAKQEIRVYTIEDGKKKRTINFDRKGARIFKFAYKTMPSGELICAGFYGEKSGEFIGYFYESYLPNQSEPNTSNFSPFELSDINSAKEYGEVKRHLDGDQMGVRDMILKADGGLVIIAQLSKISTYTSQSGGYSSFSYGDAILFSIESDGEFAWAERIYQLPSPYPTQWVLQADQVNFFLSQSENEEIRNTLSGSSLKNITKNVHLTYQIEMITIGLNGGQSSQVLVPAGSTGHQVNIRVDLLQDGKTVILPGIEKTSPQLIKLSY